MPWVDRTCDLCHRWTEAGQFLGQVYVCRECAQKVADDTLLPIPEGHVYDFFFYSWLARTGRINESI